MIFLTGAAGKTGHAILAALAKLNAPVKPLVRSEAQVVDIQKIAKFECITGDLRKLANLESQLDGVDIIYYICPNVAPDELEIGKNLIQLAKKKNISRFIYHSVLHPNIESMPHHWQKMRMEEALFASELDFTILQPCAYMQNILAGWNNIKAGKYITPYQTNSRLSIVDLKDVAEVAARVMTQSGFENAIFELAGPENLSQKEVSQQITQVVGYPVSAVEQSREDWQKTALLNGMDPTQVLVLLKMFEYYDKNGLVGNTTTLGNLLGHSPTRFNQFLERILKSGEVY